MLKHTTIWRVLFNYHKTEGGVNMSLQVLVACVAVLACSSLLVVIASLNIEHKQEEYDAEQE